jgi:tripartite-type tricarboxylate transporter receptor subunit TctC
MKTRIAIVAAAAVMAFGCVGAFGQGVGGKPVRLLVPSPPGGPTDFAARLVAPRLSEALGQNVVVDNRGSANGIVGAELAAHAAPDGLTLIMGNSGTHAINAGPEQFAALVKREIEKYRKLISAAGIALE